jgi:hypothetical protein
MEYDEIIRDWGKIVYTKNEQHVIPFDEEGKLSIEHQINMNCFCDPEMHDHRNTDGTIVILHNVIVFH